MKTKLIGVVTGDRTFLISVLILQTVSSAYCEITSLRSSSQPSPWVIRHDPSRSQETIARLPPYVWDTQDDGASCTKQAPQLNFWCEGCTPDNFYLDQDMQALRIVTKDLPGTELDGIIKASAGTAHAEDLFFKIVIDQSAVGIDRQLLQEQEFFKDGPTRGLASDCSLTSNFVLTPSASTSYEYTQNTGPQTISFPMPTYAADCAVPPEPDPDSYARGCSDSNYEDLTYNAVTGLYEPVVDWFINQFGCPYLTTDGYSLTIQTDAVNYAPVNSWMSFEIYWYLQYAYPSSVSRFTISETILVIIAENLVCTFTTITTDNAITGTTIYYARGDASASYTFDTVISTTEDCGWTAWTTTLDAPAGYTDISQLGLSVDNTNDPATLEIADYGTASGPATETLTMTFYIIPDENTSQTKIYKTFTYVLYTPLTAVTSTAYSSSQEFIGSTYTFAYPTWTLTPSDLSTVLKESLFNLSFDGTALVVNGVDAASSVYISYDSTAFYMTTTESAVAMEGTHTFDFQWTWDDTFAFSEVFTFSLSHEIICAVLRVTTDSALTSTLSYIIFDAASTHSFSTYTQAPACGVTPVTSLLYSTTSGGATSAYSGQTWVTSDSATYLTVEAADYTLDSTTIYLYQSTDYDGYFTQSEEMAVTFTDPCKKTAFVDQTIAVIEQFININTDYPVGSLTVDLPVLDDDTNVLYGTDSANSICYTQTVTVTESGVTPSFMTHISSTSVTLATTTTSAVGEHYLDFVYLLDRYTSITTTLSTTVILYLLEDPNTSFEDQFYVVNLTALSLSVEYMTVYPDSDEITIVHTVTLDDGSVLPAFISFVETTASQTVDITFVSTDSEDAGDYSMIVTATATHSNGQVSVLSTSAITLSVTATAAFTVNAAPEWDEDVPVIWSFDAGSAFNYTLPGVTDEEGDLMTIVVDIGAASMFLTYVDGVFTVVEGASGESQAGTYSITITVTDTAGSVLSTTISLTVLSKAVEEDEAEEVTEASNGLDFLNSLWSDPNGWSWGDQLAALLNKKRLYKPIDPEVSMKKITQKGKVTFEFTKNMIVPPLDIIRNATFPVNGVNFTAIELRVAPGYYSDMENLKFTYNITDYSMLSMTMEILWDKPLYVSMDMESRDWLEAQFRGNFFFFDEDGLFIKKDLILTRILPTQLPLGGAAEALADSGGSTTAATQIMMGGNLIVNLLLSASLQYLWGMINTQQIILMMPLFALAVPANASIFFGFLMQIAAFDIFPMEQLYDFFGFNNTDPMNPNLEAEGFASTLFIYNVGSMIFALLMYPLFVILVLILKCFRLNKKSWLARKRKSWGEHLFWGHFITTIFESYAVLCMCIFINLRHIEWTDTGQTTSLVLTMIFLIVVVLSPPVFSIILMCNWKKVGTKQFDIKYATLYENIDVSRGRMTILEPFSFLVRRLLLAYICVYPTKLIFQILVLFFQVHYQVTLVAFVRPYKEKSQHALEYFNETIIMILLYTFLCFSDLVRTPESRFTMGFVCCATVTFHLAFNIGLILYFNILGCRDKCKIKRMEKLKKRRIADRQKMTKLRGKDEPARKVLVVPELAADQKAELAEVAAQLEEIKEVDEESASTDRGVTRVHKQSHISLDISVETENDDANRDGKKHMNNTGQFLVPKVDPAKELEMQQQQLHMDEMSNMFENIHGGLTSLGYNPNVVPQPDMFHPKV